MHRLRLAASPQTCYWIISDGRVFHNSGPLNAWLDLLGFKYYGTDTSIQSLTDNKYLMSIVMKNQGFLVPSSWLYRGKTEISSLDGISDRNGHYFVKPNTLGSQIGISRTSRVSTFKEAIDLSVWIFESFGTESIIQSYIEGNDARLSAVEFDQQNPAFECSRVRVCDRNGMLSSFSCNRAISGRQWFLEEIDVFKNEINDQASIIAKTLVKLGIVRDYFAVDFRILEEKNLVFLENNVKPFVSNHAFGNLAEKFKFQSVGHLFLDSILRRFNHSDKLSQRYYQHLRLGT